MKDETALWVGYAEENLRSAQLLLKASFIIHAFRTLSRP
jgi:hypothetical protein